MALAVISSVMQAARPVCSLVCLKRFDLSQPYHAKRSYPVLQRARRAPCRCAASSNDDMDVAVFRFTLGIPGFDDSLIPRVVGIVGAALLLINHLLAQGAASGAQERAEVLGAVLAAVAVAAPSLEQRLREAQPGKGRQAAAEDVAGGKNAFALEEALPDAVRQELAWASVALLRNSNICGLAVVWQGRVVMCRGIVGEAVAAAGSGKELQAATQAWAQSAPAGSTLYCADRSELQKAGLHTCALIPAGASAVLVQGMQPSMLQDGGGDAAASAQGALILISERERALTAKQRIWAQSLACKLHWVFSQMG